MYKCEREEEIMSLLRDCEYATVEYLSKKMNISASSIRRDLKNLEERGLVNRSYGGVRLAESGGKRIPFSLRSQENSAQKKQIARAALQLIREGDVVFLDGSSTVLFLADLIASVPGVTVITNGIDVMSCLSGYGVRAYCTGGAKSGDNGSVLVGSYATRFLESIHADVAIFSVQALHGDGRFFDCYAEEVAVRNAMLKNASRRILLCDSSKLDKPSTFYQGCVDDVDFIVCDKPLDGFFRDPTPEKYLLAE